MAKILLGSFALAVCEHVVSPQAAVFSLGADLVGLEEINEVGRGVEEDIVVAFSKFKRDFHRQYDDASEEHQVRLAQFKRSFIQVHHLGGAPISGGEFVFGEFSDATDDEVSQARNGLTPSNPTKFLDHALTAWNAPGTLAVADGVDWRMLGAVTPVKDQGQCGSCWAFTTTAVLEGAVKVATGTLVDISEEQFLDCDLIGQNKCTSGNLFNAFRWAENNGLCSESIYPYQQVHGPCAVPNCNSIPAGCVTGTYSIRGGENALLQVVNTQPVAVAIWAGLEFQHYQGGVVSMPCTGNVNHGVVVVGYTPDAWIVKNSYGLGWGEVGYAYFDRQVDNPFCMYLQPMFATVSPSCDLSGGGGVATRENVWQRFVTSILFWPSVATLAFISFISVIIYLKLRGGKVKRAAADGTSASGVSMLGM